MAQIKAEQVYCHNGTDLWTRPGRIRLEDQNRIKAARHFSDRLQVVSGLLPYDVAVFFTVTPSRDDLRKDRFDPLSLTFGYLVSDVGPVAGKGSLVKGDACDISPAEYTTAHMEDTWELLGRSNYAPDEFSLFGLASYLTQSRLTEAS